MPNLAVKYQGDPWNKERNVKVENVSHETQAGKVIITFTLTWGGIGGLRRHRRTFRSNPISDTQATSFTVWPAQYTVTSEALLEWRDGTDGQRTRIGTQIIQE